MGDSLATGFSLMGAIMEIVFIIIIPVTVYVVIPVAGILLTVGLINRLIEGDK
jgi:hypothetical protein